MVRQPLPSAPAAATHRCGLCGKPFTEDRAQPACRACPLGSSCRYVRCPHCGYENPMTPGWLRVLREWTGGEGEP